MGNPCERDIVGEVLSASSLRGTTFGLARGNNLFALSNLVTLSYPGHAGRVSEAVPHLWIRCYILDANCRIRRQVLREIGMCKG